MNSLFSWFPRLHLLLPRLRTLVCTVPTQVWSRMSCQGCVDCILLQDTQSRGLKGLDSSGQSMLTLHLVTRNLCQGAVCSMSQPCSCELPAVLVQNCPTASFCDTDFTEFRGGMARGQGPNSSSSTASFPRTAPPSCLHSFSSPFSISISLLLSPYLLFSLPLFFPLLSFSFSQEQLDHFIHSFCPTPEVNFPHRLLTKAFWQTDLLPLSQEDVAAICHKDNARP